MLPCTEQEHTVARDDRIESECALYRTIKFVGGARGKLKALGVRARVHMRIAHCAFIQ